MSATANGVLSSCTIQRERVSLTLDVAGLTVNCIEAFISSDLLVDGSENLCWLRVVLAGYA